MFAILQPQIWTNIETFSSIQIYLATTKNHSVPVSMEAPTTGHSKCRKMWNQNTSYCSVFTFPTYLDYINLVKRLVSNKIRCYTLVIKVKEEIRELFGGVWCSLLFAPTKLKQHEHHAHAQAKQRHTINK